jgi:hypothetical protein
LRYLKWVALSIVKGTQGGAGIRRKTHMTRHLPWFFAASTLLFFAAITQ